jgi:hypothetical protein
MQTPLTTHSSPVSSKPNLYAKTEASSYSLVVINGTYRGLEPKSLAATLHRAVQLVSALPLCLVFTTVPL